jgi:hypothetical protein
MPKYIHIHIYQAVKRTDRPTGGQIAKLNKEKDEI